MVRFLCYYAHMQKLDLKDILASFSADFNGNAGGRKGSYIMSHSTEAKEHLGAEFQRRFDVVVSMDDQRTIRPDAKVTA
jgi:hypothetical protein